MSRHALPDRVEKDVRTYDLIPPGSEVVVALSGGPDSTCLLIVLQELSSRLSLKLRGLYVDHGLRPRREIEEEGRFCTDLCDGLGIPFETVGIAIRSGREETGNVQESARLLRYQALHDHAARVGANRIGTGHNLDDNAETILMHLIRGASRRGLSGIPIRRGRIIRPLLRTSRKEIAAFLESRGISPMTDSSNRKDMYLRNRLRNQVLPILESMNPEVLQAITRMGTILGEEDAIFEECSKQLFGPMERKRSPSAIMWERSLFDCQPRALKKRLLIHAIRELRGHGRGLGAEHIEAALRTMDKDPPRTASLPDGMVLRRERECYALRRAAGPPALPEQVLPIPGKVFLSEGMRIESRICGLIEAIPDSRDAALVPRRLLGQELHVRGRKPGDFFYPLGMAGKKKLQDFFVDLKVPVVERDGVPIVLSGDQIVWVAGYRLDDRFRCRPETPEETVRLQLYRPAV